jgi:hypothetical protein
MCCLLEQHEKVLALEPNAYSIFRNMGYRLFGLNWQVENGYEHTARKLAATGKTQALTH